MVRWETFLTAHLQTANISSTAFTKAPKNMRSLVMSMFLFTNAISAALGQAWVTLSDDPLLVWNYASVAIISGVAGILFWQTVKKLDREEDKLNMLPQGHVARGEGSDTDAEELYPSLESGKHGEKTSIVTGEHSAGREATTSAGGVHEDTPVAGTGEGTIKPVVRG